MPIVSVNSIVVNPKDLGNIPIKPEENVYLRDLGTVEDTHGHPDRLGPGQRPARGLHADPQNGRRLDADGGHAAEGQHGRHAVSVLPEDVQAGAGVRSVALRHRRRRRRGAGIGHRRRADGADGAAVPARLAQRDRGGAHHSAVADGRPDRPVASPARAST